MFRAPQEPGRETSANDDTEAIQPRSLPMAFIVAGLPVEPFQPLFGRSDEALAERNIVRRTVEAGDRMPCRITLDDAAPGDTLLLVNYEHQDAATPYRSTHAIFVNERAAEP